MIDQEIWALNCVVHEHSTEPKKVQVARGTTSLQQTDRHDRRGKMMRFNVIRMSIRMKMARLANIRLSLFMRELEKKKRKLILSLISTAKASSSTYFEVPIYYHHG